MEEHSAGYGQYKEETDDSDAMTQLGILAQKQLEAEEEVIVAEQELKRKKEALREVSEREIPELMASLQMKSFTLESGERIEVIEKLRCSIAGERAPNAVAWLDSNNHGDLVKRNFTIEFNRDEQSWVNKFIGDLKKRKRQLRVSQKNTVHPSTLASFLTERLTEGDEIPMELFGAYWQRTSKVKK